MSTTPVFAIPEDFSVDSKKLSSLEKELKEAGVDFCLSTYVDIHGVPKAKVNPVSCLEKMAKGSELFTLGAMEGMGLVGPQEDEAAAVPDLDTYIQCPWDERIAVFFGDLYYHGLPYPHAARQILKRQVERAAAMGFTLNMGCETEFYVLNVEKDSGDVHSINPTKFEGVCPAYDVKQSLDALPFLEPMAKYMESLDWGLYSFDQEGGHSQFEFDFKYADALTMSDRVIFMRLMAKQVAESIGANATFMPKPFANDFRSGCHFNMSLADVETGENLFAPAEGGDSFSKKHGIPVSDLAYHFMAGILANAPAITAVTCPSYNSYQGLIAQGDMPDISWAPVLIAYGRNNRSSMLRVPLNRYCVENRAPDMGCNPYLAAAVQLAAGLDGIEQKLDPGKPLNDNCYDLTRAQMKEAGIHLLPRTLLHALEAFEESTFMDGLFGDFKEIYLTQKMAEWSEGFYPINHSHRKKYLNYI
ncbi:MAG: glutamine synthetase [Verrucomicrobiales bacterium]|nr:glutamine synthetase [Verrucomicrobiales bacterium]